MNLTPARLKLLADACSLYAFVPRHNTEERAALLEMAANFAAEAERGQQTELDAMAAKLADVSAQDDVA